MMIVTDSKSKETDAIICITLLPVLFCGFMLRLMTTNATYRMKMNLKPALLHDCMLYIC